MFFKWTWFGPSLIFSCRFIKWVNYFSIDWFQTWFLRKINLGNHFSIFITWSLFSKLILLKIDFLWLINYDLLREIAFIAKLSLKLKIENNISSLLSRVTCVETETGAIILSQSASCIFSKPRHHHLVFYHFYERNIPAAWFSKR